MKNRKLLFWVTMTVSTFGLGIAMPSCPGQQAMQQQVDLLQTKNRELSTRIQTMENSLKTMTADLDQLRQLPGKITPALQSYQAELEKINTAITAMQTQMKSGGSKAAPAKGGAKKKGRK